MRLILIFLAIVASIWLIFQIIPTGNDCDTRNLTLECLNRTCIEESIDHFDNCIELGKEKIGLLTYEKYHLCDGVKIVNKCLERSNEYYILNKTNISGYYFVPGNCHVIEKECVN